MTRTFLAFLCSFLLACPAALSRDVFFDVQDPHPMLHKQLAPYCKNARIEVEKLWDQVDPHNGQSVSFLIVLERDGKIGELYPLDPGNNPLIGRAVYAVVNSGGFGPLPDGQNGLSIVARFKSKNPSPQVDPSAITDALIAAGLIAAAGFAIYGLIKASKSSSNSAGQGNPNYHLVRAHVTADGVYIPEHYQTNPNGTILDNYSTRGNINPWTGQPGWIDP